MKKITLILTTCLIGGILLLIPQALAEEIILNLNDGGSFNVKEILSTNNGENQDGGQEFAYFSEDEENPPLMAFILQIINMISRVIGIIAMILIVIGALLMIISEGDESRLDKGKQTLVSAIIGLIIAMASFMIVSFFQSLFYLAG